MSLSMISPVRGSEVLGPCALRVRLADQRTTEYRTSAFKRHPITGEELWFNQIAAQTPHPRAIGEALGSILPNAEVHDLPPGSRGPFLTSLAAEGIAGGRIYDAHIGEALLTFAAQPAADAALSKAILSNKLDDAQSGNGVYGRSDEDLYRNLLHPEQYHWGSNSIRVNYANSNLAMVTHGLDPAGHGAYRARARGTLHYQHGVNPFGIVYLSNMYRYGASYSANEIFHTWYAPRTRWSNAVTSECGPAPGYLVGGPNASAADDGVPTDLVPPVGQPAQKSFRDWNEGWPEASYVVTEPSIGFQASYVRLLAAFVDHAPALRVLDDIQSRQPLRRVGAEGLGAIAERLPALGARGQELRAQRVGVAVGDHRPLPGAAEMRSTTSFCSMRCMSWMAARWSTRRNSSGVEML